MDPISNADRLVILLRQRLLERSKAAAGRGDKATRSRNDEPATPSAVRALAGVRDAGDAPLRRALIQDLLVEQLGPDLLNDAQFQQIVSRVTETIEADEDGAHLLSQVVSELRP